MRLLGEIKKNTKHNGKAGGHHLRQGDPHECEGVLHPHVPQAQCQSAEHGKGHRSPILLHQIKSKQNVHQKCEHQKSPLLPPWGKTGRLCGVLHLSLPIKLSPPNTVLMSLLHAGGPHWCRQWAILTEIAQRCQKSTRK